MGRTEERQGRLYSVQQWFSGNNNRVIERFEKNVKRDVDGVA